MTEKKMTPELVARLKERDPYMYELWMQSERLNEVWEALKRTGDQSAAWESLAEIKSHKPST